MKVSAAGWMDKQPMLVVATCGNNEVLPPSERVRCKYQQGSIVRATYQVEERVFHGTYRKYFNTIDIHNKLAIGPGTVAAAWKSKRPLMKFFLYILSVIETNAYLAYRFFSDDDPDISRREWKNMLADELIKYGRSILRHKMATRHRSSGASNQSPSCRSARTMMSVTSVSGLESSSVLPRRNMYSVTAPLEKNPTTKRSRNATSAATTCGQRFYCIICKKQGRSMCSLCNKCVCSSSTGRPCFAEHVAHHLLEADWCDAQPSFASP